MLALCTKTSKFGRGVPNGDSFLAVEEGGFDFDLRGGRHNVAHDLEEGMDGAAEGRTGVGSTGRIRGVVDQEVVPVGAAPCLWFRNIGDVAVDMEDHVNS